MFPSRIDPITGQERIQPRAPQEQTPRPGDDSGPKSPNVRRPEPGDLLKRMRRVDPDQARRYRQRSGQ
jgi:hypothetical protein